ncbi:ATP synthase subunit e, mitochondrial-like [Patiria miniata]|uniref:ATP synthase F(0) complex subunit e, mitochondrial n=1 Tax=Patiria miniata TaxID=46514 RepID=A0A913Z127_PATMI|nr:ATP synthase subunit e, mitochondrial-like [Patiria miniata]
MSRAPAQISKMAPVPVAVSPLIKFSRYSALFLGIAYGSRRNKSLEKSEGELLRLKELRKAADEKKVAAAAKEGGGSIFD